MRQQYVKVSWSCVVGEAQGEQLGLWFYHELIQCVYDKLCKRIGRTVRRWYSDQDFERCNLQHADIWYTCTKDMTDSSSDVTSTLKRKPSSVSSTKSEDSPIVGKPKPKKQEKKRRNNALYLKSSRTGRRKTNKIWSLLSLLWTFWVRNWTHWRQKMISTSLEQRYSVWLTACIIKLTRWKAESLTWKQKMTNCKLKLKKIQENNKDLKNRIDQYDKENRQLRRNQNEHYLRRWNCRVYKVPEVERETANNCIKKCVKVFTKDIGVKVTETDIDVAHRIGPPPPKGRSRPIIVRFLSRRARDLVVSNGKNLKNKGVAVGEDLTKVNYRLLLAAEKHSATLAAWSSNGKILSKFKNGRIIRVNIDMDINVVFNKGLNHKGSEDDSVTGKWQWKLHTVCPLTSFGTWQLSD